jgi:hypothetical protein
MITYHSAGKKENEFHDTNGKIKFIVFKGASDTSDLHAREKPSDRLISEERAKLSPSALCFEIPVLLEPPAGSNT